MMEHEPLPDANGIVFYSPIPTTRRGLVLASVLASVSAALKPTLESKGKDIYGRLNASGESLSIWIQGGCRGLTKAQGIAAMKQAQAALASQHCPWAQTREFKLKPWYPGSKCVQGEMVWECRLVSGSKTPTFVAQALLSEHIGEDHKRWWCLDFFVRPPHWV